MFREVFGLVGSRCSSGETSRLSHCSSSTPASSPSGRNQTMSWWSLHYSRNVWYDDTRPWTITMFPWVTVSLRSFASCVSAHSVFCKSHCMLTLLRYVPMLPIDTRRLTKHSRRDAFFPLLSQPNVSLVKQNESIMNESELSPLVNASSEDGGT